MRADPDAVHILDLDGTILSANSFPHWVLYFSRAPFPHFGKVRRLGVSCAVLALLASRKLGLTRHEHFKWRLQRLWQAVSEGDGGAAAARFVERLTRFVRPELAPVLAAIAAGEVDAVLATAAPADYAHALGVALGFRHTLATLSGRAKGAPSNVGEQKRQAVLDFLARRGWQDRRRILFTDHEDDLPLVAVCDQVYWFGSEDSARAAAAAVKGVPIELGLVRA